MPEIHFTNLLIVTVAAFIAPFTLGVAPSVLLPAVVLEIVLGIVIGPAGLGWVTIDEPIQVLSLVGLAFPLFLAGETRWTQALGASRSAPSAVRAGIRAPRRAGPMRRAARHKAAQRP